MKDDDSSWSVKRRNIVDMTGWMVNNLTANPFAITEIMVPTCSYRMGEKDIGYGIAIIRKLDAKMILGVRAIPVTNFLKFNMRVPSNLQYRVRFTLKRNLFICAYTLK